MGVVRRIDLKRVREGQDYRDALGTAMHTDQSPAINIPAENSRRSHEPSETGYMSPKKIWQSRLQSEASNMKTKSLN